MPPLTELLFNLDTPQLVATSPQESYLKGWFVPPQPVGAWRIMAFVDGREALVYTGFPRPDVRRHLGIVGAGRFGFVVRLRNLQPEQRVSLAVEIDGAVKELVRDLQLQGDLPKANGGEDKVSSYREWIFGREPYLFLPHTDPGALVYRPTISLLVEFQECPVYFLSMFLRTLSAQVYPDWQLCIAGHFEVGSESFEHLKHVAATDRRIAFIPLLAEADSAAVFNTALEKAEGDFVMQARLYDELHPLALLEIAKTVGSREVDLVYSDEDRMDLFGGRYRPQFKPNFDGEHLLSVNYLGHLAAVRHGLAQVSGGFRLLLPEAQEWDFLLRCTAQIGRDRVAHIAKPLYHLRTREALAEAGVEVASAQPDDLCQVIRDVVERTKKQAVVQVGFPTDTIRLKYQLPRCVRASVFLRDEDGIFQVAALADLVNRLQIEFYGVLNGIAHRLPPTGASSDLTLRPPLLSFAEISGDVFLFINRPIDLLNHFFLEELIAQALRPDCGLVAGLAVDPAGRFIHTGFIQQDGDECIDPFAGSNSRLKVLGRHVRVTRSVRAISDEFFAVRRELVETAGGFAQLSSMPQFIKALAEQAHRLRLQVLVTPYAVGSFDCLDQLTSEPPLAEGLVGWNPNLGAFSDPYEMLQP